MGDIKNSYGVSEMQMKVLKDQAARRATNRAIFLKDVSNPHRPNAFVFDPAMQRFNALTVYEKDFFKPNAKTGRLAMMLFVIPGIIYGYVIYKDRVDKEHMYSTGQVAYRDRLFKFI